MCALKPAVDSVNTLQKDIVWATDYRRVRRRFGALIQRYAQRIGEGF